MSAIWTGPAVLGAVNEVVQHHFAGDSSAITRGAALWTASQWLICGLFTPLIFAGSNRWPFVRVAVWSRAVMHTSLALVFCTVWAALGVVLRQLLIPVPIRSALGLYFLRSIIYALPFGLAIYFAMVGTEHAIRVFQASRERDIQVTRLSQQLSQARFAALQAQLNPHFLFNTLNTIAVLVRDGDKSSAARVVEHLSGILRRTLGRAPANELSLQEELSLVRDYLAIERERYSDRLLVTYDIDATVVNAAVPTFAVQHLVENAVRHGIANSQGSGEVVVAARRDHDHLLVSVTDDGSGVTSTSAAGHGLNNTRERLQELYGRNATLEIAAATRGTVALLRVPYRVLRPETMDEGA